MTYEDLRSALQAAIVAALPDDGGDDDNWVYVYDFSDSFVIYYSDGEYLQDDYTQDDDGNVTLAGTPTTVRPVTTYEPVTDGRSARVPMEMRGMPQAAAALLGQRQLQSGQIRVTSEPLTYHRHGRYSYFRDFLLADRVPGARDRLARHAQEMDTLSRERDERAWRALRSADLEYRVEPNRTDGQGGYFAPPAWLNELFATAKRPGRVLAGLIPGFDLPIGVAQVNLPIIAQGTTVVPESDNQVVADMDITDQAGSSAVATLSGMADVALQLLEQSPAGAHLDWVVFTELTQAFDLDCETQLLTGLGAGFNQILGVMNQPTTTGNAIAVTYTDSSPTGSEMWPFFGQAAAQLGDGRLLPPEAWLMRTARWAWLNVSEDTANRPFSLPSPFFMGSDISSPDPVGGLIGWPTFLTDAIPATLGAGNNQDVVISIRPSDMIFFRSSPQVAVAEDFGGSANLTVRLRLHGRAANITRYPSGIAVIGGTGMAVQSGF